MAIKEYVGKKSPVTVGLIAVFVVAVVAALFGGGISGRAISYAVVDTTYPVAAEMYGGDAGWGECVGLEVEWSAVDNFCKMNGYPLGAVTTGDRPCYHEWQPTRYAWDGTLSADGKMVLDYERVKSEAGQGFTAIKCLTA